jgi:hypothetical protein
MPEVQGKRPYIAEGGAVPRNAPSPGPKSGEATREEEKFMGKNESKWSVVGKRRSGERTSLTLDSRGDAQKQVDRLRAAGFDVSLEEKK